MNNGGLTIEIPKSLIVRLRTAQKVVVLTGAGISAESGIPTFRDVQTGLWAKYDPHDLATPEAFNRDPGLVWRWYSWRRQLISDAKPNAGHVALVQMERKVPNLFLVTQNIDNLHSEAGSQALIELHGNIFRAKCVAQGHLFVEWQHSDQEPPRCPICGSLLRPDVVWFGETPPVEALEVSIRNSGDCDIFFSVGTSAVVYPAASLVHIALERGAIAVEINLTPTPLSSMAHVKLRGPAAVVLPALVNETFSS